MGTRGALALALVASGCGSSGEATTGGGAAASSAVTASSGAGGTGAASSSATASSTASTGGAGGPLGCVTDVGAGHHAFPCGGGITYDVEIPAACVGGGCGLVLDVHGYTMNAGQEDQGTAMRALGQQRGYVVVQPTAPGSPPGWDQPTHAPLVFAFVSDVAAALAVDPKRRHATGFSQGGGMTWRMLCAHADFFASVAPLSGVAGCEFAGSNAPSREVPVLQVHGHDDKVLAFATYAIPERDAALAYWKHGAGTVIESDAAHTATRYLTAAGTPFEFWEHDYSAESGFIGGHCFPGGGEVGPSPFQFGCADPGTFVVGALAMQFFVDHPMP